MTVQVLQDYSFSVRRYGWERARSIIIHTVRQIRNYLTTRNSSNCRYIMQVSVAVL
jgi:hypothetical protein